MPQEIEIKLKVEDHAPIRARLKTLGAKPHGIVRETNIFFDRPNRSLRKSNTGLRVRFTVLLSNLKSQVKNQTPTALLTFKGPAARGGLHSREAFDLTLSPHDQIIPLLEALGFQQTHAFEKIRESWKLKKCLIELDTLPHFGTFLEIEGPSESIVQSVQKKLHLNHLPPHRDSYSKMVAEYLKEKSPRELGFTS